jgi:hypothetical protein
MCRFNTFKVKLRYTATLLLPLLFFGAGRLYAQPVSVPFTEVVQQFADTIGPAIPFMTHYGLDWSTPYVGQLIGEPVHLGIGLAFSSTFVSNKKIAQLATEMGMTAPDSSLAPGKQWFPVPALVARMGGMAEIPLDIGLMFGYMPKMELWGNLQYATTIIGFDLHYRVLQTSETGPTGIVGLGFDYIEASAAGVLATEDGVDIADGGVSSNGINGANFPGYPGMYPDGTDYDRLEGPAKLYWKSTVIKLRLLIAQPMWESPVTMFGGIDLGYHMSKAGFRLGVAKADRFEYLLDVPGGLAIPYGGIGVKIGPVRMDLSIMMNLINYETGFGFNMRFQS